MIPTSQGQDAITLLEHGVVPGLSQRSMGRSVLLEESGGYVEEVLELEFVGMDATIDPADLTADLSLQESAMRLRNLRGVPALQRAPDDGGASGQTGSGQADPPVAVGIADVIAPLIPQPIADPLSADDRRRLQELADRERRTLISDAINQALSDAPYDAVITRQIADAVRALDLPNVDAVAGAIERQRAVADAMLSQAQLLIMGRPSPRGPIVSGGDSPALVPDYAKAQLAITDSLVLASGKPSMLARLAHPQSPGERLAVEYLRMFDRVNRDRLIAESRMFQDAELTSDLPMPTTTLRTIASELLPRLIALSIFNVATVDPAPIVSLPYESYSNEAGVALTVADEAITATDDTWKPLAHQFLTFGTVVVTSDPAGTTYTEFTDYVVDYMGGRIMGLGAGTINGAAILVDYGYSAVQKGEMQPIERGKLTIAYFALTMAAQRLATQISSEAIVFSRAGLGYDVVGRAIQRIIFELRRMIDGGLFHLALAEALLVSGNLAGTWTAATDTYDDLFALVGVAKVKVANRFFTPTAILMSETNADRVSNSNIFTAAGARTDASLNGAGYVGEMKGLPVYATTEFQDTYLEVINRDVVYYRIGRAMQLAGPFPSYHTDGKLIAADQWYIEQYGAATGDPGHQGKASVVKMA